MTRTLDEYPESEVELSPLEGYARWAASYDHDGNPLMAVEGPAVLELCGAVGGRDVLDLGAGTGRHALALAKLGARVVAVDQSPEMLAVAQTKPGAEAVTWIVHALPQPLPFADETFDAVIMGLVAEHIARLDFVITEVRRVLRPNGRLVLSGLHPNVAATGQRARFIDHESQTRQPILTLHRSERSYVDLAAAAGLELLEARSLVVESAHAEALPRARRYVGVSLGWVGSWRKPER